MDLSSFEADLLPSKVNPLGLAFSLVCVSDLLLISPNGDILAGGRPERQIYNTAAFEIQ